MKRIASMLILVIILTGCQPANTPQATPAPVEALAGSVADLEGTWWLTQCPCFLEINADGTYRVWDNYSGTQAEGSFTLDAGKITWVTSQPTCNDRQATYEAYVTKQDGKPVQLRLVETGSDPCSTRAENVRGIAKIMNP